MKLKQKYDPDILSSGPPTRRANAWKRKRTMFAKFVCIVALVASTSAMAAPHQIAKAPAALPTAGIKEIFVDEISRGGWSKQAEARYDSWMDGLEALNNKNCRTPIHYKLDVALCEQLTKIAEYVNDAIKIMLSNNGLPVPGEQE